MYIYNVTTKVHWSIHEQWVAWMKLTHIPAVIATGCFTHHHLVRLLDTDDSEGPTYAVQYFSNTKEDYERYIEFHATILREESFKKWGDLFISFRSLMELIH